MKNIRTKITFVFFCLLFLAIAGCSSAPPPPEEDPLYQTLNSDGGSMSGRPPAPDALVSRDADPRNALGQDQGRTPFPPAIPYPTPAAPNAPNATPEPATAQAPAAPIAETSPSNISANPTSAALSQLPYTNPYANVAPARPQPFLNLPPKLITQQQAVQPEPEPDYDFSQVDCNIDEDGIKEILAEVRKRKSNVIKFLPSCLKLNRSLMMRAAIVDPSEFQYAADVLKEDESFVRRMLEINPEVLQFASASLRADPAFMEQATYLNRNALQYADPKLLNKKIFMRNIIGIDAKNYMFAAERLKELPELAEVAFEDDGTLLKYAPIKIRDDKKLVTIAVKSNADALQYASDRLKEDNDLKKLSVKKSSIKSEDNLHEFLSENYVNDSDKKNIGIIIDNRMKFFADNKIIDRNYITKWQRSYNPKDDTLRLIAADSRNFPVSWKDDFKKFPLLIQKIEKFLLNHQVDQSTIDNLSTVYFWKVKRKPQTVVFNLYLLRDSKDAELGSKFGNVTSLTAVAQKHDEKWDLSVVEVIFDSEMKLDLAYENGHKKYVLWDLYEVDKKDQNPKIIFKVEDKFREYFEIFEEQNNGKYRMIYQIDSLKDAATGKKEATKIISEDDSF